MDDKINSDLQEKLKLIPTCFPTEEEREFWARFAKQHVYTDEAMPIGIYWADLRGRVIFMNSCALKSLKVPAKEVFGHTTYNYYPEDIATSINKADEYVFKTKKLFVGEQKITNYETGEILYCESSIEPLFHHETGALMGTFGAAVDITAKKKLKLINDEYEELALQLVGDMHELMNKYRITMLYNRIGDDIPIDNYKNFIHLTKREQDVLFLLSHHKNSKEIAQILSKIENKEVSHFTVHAVIGKSLYTKFNVLTTSELIEKANLYGLIPITI